MKKKLLALTLLFVSVGTVSTFAANDSKDKPGDKKECTKGQQCKKGDKECFNPFIGITLTADQQNKLKALKPAACGQDKNCKQKSECKKSDCKKGDNAGQQARPDRRQGKRDYISKVKEILTPEQYVVFLENIVVNGPDMKKGPTNDGRHGDKAQRGPRVDNSQNK